MRYLVRDGLKFVVGLILLGSWIVISGGLAITAQLMSLDEEWEGWGDAFGIAVVVPYLAFTAAVIGGLWLIFRARA